VQEVGRESPAVPILDVLNYRPGLETRGPNLPCPAISICEREIGQQEEYDAANRDQHDPAVDPQNQKSTDS
jgi:hypothetical protein